MNTNKSHKSPQSLVIGDTFTHVGERYTVIGQVTQSALAAHAMRPRMSVPTNKGTLNIPVSVPLKMV